MTAAYWKIGIEQGATWRAVLVLSDTNGIVDLSGYTARMQIRQEIDSPAPLYELTTEDGGIAIDGPAGQITLVIPDTVSTAWTWRHGLYDLELVAGGGDVERLLKGEVDVDQEVTR